MPERERRRRESQAATQCRRPLQRSAGKTHPPTRRPVFTTPRSCPSPQVQLIIFGDSWCKADGYLRTWPELLGERLGWPTINVAIPGSDSRMLGQQCDLLLAVLRRRQLDVHEDAWVLIHTGGNDLMSSHPRQLFGFVGVRASRGGGAGATALVH